ncbi:MAG: DUF1631 domain-containing protein [Pseudomonadales bacterium]|nr:DUF1631 domain-containing protein [Pseudomonadales bacterium]
MGSAATTQTYKEERSALLKLIHTIPGLLSDAYENQLGAIRELAESLENYQEHSTYQNVNEELNRVKPSVLRAIAKEFNNHLDANEKVSALEEDKALNFHADNLSIVTDSEIDYQLMLERGFSESNHNFSGMLVESGWKFCSAVKRTDVNNQLECIRPGFLAYILQNALDHFIEDKQIARIAYRFIGADFFKLTKDFFQGITPELSNLVIAYSEQHAELEEPVNTQQQPAANFSGSNLPVAEVENGVTAEDIEQINKTLGTNIDVTGLIKNWDVPAQLSQGRTSQFDGFAALDLSQISPDTEIRTATVDDVAQLLKSLANDSMNDPEAGLDSNDVRSALKESLSKLSDDGILTVIDRVSENVLNLVSHLFDTLYESGSFITEVENQFSRLQAPVMQVALTDTRMFQSSDHPVREYLNEASRLGLRISEPCEEGYLELRDSVNSLLKEFSGDVSIFHNYATELSEYTENSVYAIKLADGNFEAKDFANGMKNAAIADFLGSQNHLLEKELTFHKLLKYVWSAILARIIRRHGTESEQWKMATETYASVLWSTQVDATNEGKRQILRTLPKIVQAIRGLFLEYSLKTELRDAILEHMIQLHLAIIRGTDGKCVTEPGGASLDVFKAFQGTILEDTQDNHHAEMDAVDMPSVEFNDEHLNNVYERFDQISPFDDSQTETISAMDWGEISSEDELMIREIRGEENIDQSTANLQAVFVRLNSVPLETVFMITRDGIQTRCKLTKKSVALGKFTFKTFEGEETFDKTKAELAVELIRGDAKQIDEHNLFDNALERVVMQIQANNHAI